MKKTTQFLLQKLQLERNTDFKMGLKVREREDF